MQDPSPELRDEESCRVSAIPYALFVAVCVVMIQSIMCPGHALVLGILASKPEALKTAGGIALAAWAIIRPFANEPGKRWGAIYYSIIGLTLILSAIFNHPMGCG